MIYFILLLLLISLIGNIFLILALRRAFYHNDVLESWMIDFKFLINNTYKKLKLIDERGIFEKDDDVGFVFSDLSNIIEITNKRVQSNDDNDKPRELNEKNQDKIV